MPALLEAPASYDTHIRRVRAEYRVMPGLSPTLSQAQRLFGLDASTCRAVLNALVEEHFLRRDRDGRFVRFDLVV